MNTFTKRSLVFSILSVAAIIAGILIFAVAAGSLTVEPPESEDPGAALGSLFAALGKFITAMILLMTDIIFSSLLVYVFAYFSRKNAILALDADGERGALLKFLRIFSRLQMILSGIAASAVFIFFCAIIIISMY